MWIANLISILYAYRYIWTRLLFLFSFKTSFILTYQSLHHFLLKWTMILPYERISELQIYCCNIGVIHAICMTSISILLRETTREAVVLDMTLFYLFPCAITSRLIVLKEVKLFNCKLDSIKNIRIKRKISWF